jgi:hypothetical protein
VGGRRKGGRRRKRRACRSDGLKLYLDDLMNTIHNAMRFRQIKGLDITTIRVQSHFPSPTDPGEPQARDDTANSCDP